MSRRRVVGSEALGTLSASFFYRFAAIQIPLALSSASDGIPAHALVADRDHRGRS